ncbi:MAG: UDP-2,4-diacetamido-2,4,6-trideoxy-beta-L-altropyranose hydrolase [Acidobacteria bacterium]|jgi:UDP-2,4-diacetamido-2,4,6-trideoxy-beta-L-altropyranose hydrolase|nr:UDP-2,4-diacetamido-2,4,6-trideoxy-beta-L-altropyranose hydrolase [Acidobacteriota bacterium]
MEIIILTESGEEIGLGHVTRCLSLAQAFAARKHKIRFIVAGDDSVRDILKNNPCEIFDWKKDEKQLKQAIHNVDVVLVDSYRAEEDIYKKISETARVAVYLDDTNRLAYPAGIVVNWSISAQNLDYPDKEDVLYLLGPGYISLRRAFREVPVKEIKETITDVLVTFGGDDSKNLTPVVLRYLAQHYPMLQKHVVVGGDFKNRAEIEAAADNHTNLVFSPDDEGMKKVMMQADIAISSGGQTLYELARVGVPAVVVIVADNQENNVAGWEKTGFIENAGYWQNEHLMDVVAERFQKLSTFEGRRRASAVGHNIVPGSEAERIVRRVEDRLDIFKRTHAVKRVRKKTK